MLTAADVKLWATVDTTNLFNQQAIACLKRFFENKFHPDRDNNYWYEPNIERYVHPYRDLKYAEYK